MAIIRVLTAADSLNARRRIADAIAADAALEVVGEAGDGRTVTGMGRDGAMGLLKVRESGGQTIAQDQASSSVFGMPDEAIALHAAPLDDMAGTLCHMARRERGDKKS